MHFDDNKIYTFSPIISCNDVTEYTFSPTRPLSLPPLSLSAKEQLVLHNVERWAKLPHGHFFCRLLLKKTNTFDLSVIPPHLLLERFRNQHERGSDIAAYVLLLGPGDPDNCKHMRGVAGKQICQMSLFFYTTFVSFQHHSVCMLRMCLTASAIIGCFRRRDFTWAETQHSPAFDGGKREIKST